MLNSTIKILNAAKQCFYRHGFSATTISMISKYADVSRVTIHKQFCSKEQIFRKVIVHYNQEMIEQTASIIACKQPCWTKVDSLLTQWGDEIFKEINDEVVRNDLIYSAKQYCREEILSMREVKCNLIEQILQQGIKNNEICLDKLAMTAYEVADLIEITFSGLVNTGRQENTEKRITSLLKVYQVAAHT